MAQTMGQGIRASEMAPVARFAIFSVMVALLLAGAPAALAQGDRIWTITNEAAGNEVVTLTRRIDGSLAEIDRTQSGATSPIGVTAHGHRVYVLHSDGSIATFERHFDGRLTLRARTSAVPASATGLLAR